MNDFLWLFGAVLAGALGVRLLKSADYHLEEWNVVTAVAAWVLGCAALAFALWAVL